MINYLDFKNARCKDCYKCLRECPVKSIRFENRQARIIENRCILCGKCTLVCPQNAKKVHSEADDVKALINSGEKVIASVAPSFISSFKTDDFASMRNALKKLGFYDADETSIGAKAVTEKYKKLLDTGDFKNFITSACPAVNRMIQLYYPDALKYLAPVDTPMIAHAKILKREHPDCKVVFIGPCIAKKREAHESGIVDGVLTFEDLAAMLREKGIIIASASGNDGGDDINKAKYYPISRGIIKSFESLAKGYEYVAVDGTTKCKEVLENIENLSGMFLELNSCDYACVNGPCSLIKNGGAVEANADIRRYAVKGTSEVRGIPDDIDFSFEYKRIEPSIKTVGEREIAEILAKTGKTKPEDELNCGACGYSTCREKAWAVANGFADIEMCVPYMRERAESMSYEIIQNSPNGIIILDNDYKILELNQKAKKMLGIDVACPEGQLAFDCFDAVDFVMAGEQKKNVYGKRTYIQKSKMYIEMSIIFLKAQNVMFAVMKDITEKKEYEDRLNAVKLETLSTTDEVIKKQMRVAQEIASLLGETTAETKVALLKLKNTLQSDEQSEEEKIK